MKPVFKILADGQDITNVINERLVRLATIDKSGVQTDKLVLRLDDRDHAIQWPRHGAELESYLGYQETGLHLIGRFKVDEVGISGPPAEMLITATGANFKDSLKNPRDVAWDNKSISDIVQTIAGTHGLEPKIGSAVGSIQIEHRDQTAESDMNFLTRLAEENDVVFKVTAKHLIFLPADEAKSASGANLKVIQLQRSDFHQISANIKDRLEYSSVTSKWYDEAAAIEKKVTAGSGEPELLLRQIYKDEDEANRVANARFKKLVRGQGTLEFQTSGNPEILAESPLIISNFRDGFDGAWTAKSVRHSFDAANGFLTRVSAEIKK